MGDGKRKTDQCLACATTSKGIKRLQGQIMTFDEVLDQVRELLQQRGRVAAQRATGGQGLVQLWLALQVQTYIETGRFEEDRA